MGRYWRYLRVGVIAGDALAIVLALSLSAGARFGLAGVLMRDVLSPVYPVLVVLLVLLIVALGWQQGLYRRWALLGGHRVYPKLVSIATYGLLAVIVLSYLLGGPPLVARAWLLGSWAGMIVFLAVSRLLWRRIALRWQRKGYIVRKVLIAGANQHGIAVAQQLHDAARHGRLVVGFLDDYKRPGTLVLPGVPVVGHPGSLLECARRLGADEVIIIAGALAWESQQLLAEAVTRPDFPLDARLSPTFYDLLTTSAELSHVGYVPMLTLNRTRLSGWNELVKRYFDVCVAAVALVALTPAWSYWRVKAWLKGLPMLLQEPVLGVEGRAFDVVGLHPELSTSPVLRRLPALWNVLWQDLSLVGPRPIRAGELPAHERWLANLFAMRPGLTGLWRVRGGELPIEERVALDLYYVRNYTLSLDGQLLFNTLKQLARRMMGREYNLARWMEAEAEETSPTSPTVVKTPGDQGGRPVPESGVGLGVRS